MRIAGLASNRGRNLLRFDDLAPGGAELSVVVSDDADAPVVGAAEDRDIPTEVTERDGDGRRAHERRIVEALSPYEFDLVCLDGYTRILSDTFLDAVPTTLNVHPSLLPAFPGGDAWGDALEAGVRTSGCTVHVVTNAIDAAGNVIEEAVDAGPIVTQEPVPVYADDDRDSLKARILHRGEFRAYPRAVRWFAEGRVTVEGDRVTVEGDDGGDFPARWSGSADRARELRYGENPHQEAAVYADAAVSEANVIDAEQLNEGARALSYNNYNDADAALELVREFEEPAAAVIKHTNPAGCALGDTVAEAYDRALSTDPMSAFGGIVSANREVDAGTAKAITDSFKEVVVAPAYTERALSALGERENLRVLAVGELGERVPGTVEKPITGGRLLQERDLGTVAADDLEVVTERAPTDGQVASLLFAWKVVKHVKSNAIVFASDTETVGIGMGQVSRVDAVELAARKASEHAEGKSAAGGVMASDAFFPFPDGIEVAADAGIEAVIQPGGSLNDDDVIEAADDLGMAMAFTGTRVFRHS